MALVDRIYSILNSDKEIDVIDIIEREKNKTSVHNIEFRVCPKEPYSNVTELSDALERLYNRIEKDLGKGKYTPFYPIETGGYFIGEICYEDNKTSPKNIERKDRISIQMFPSKRYISKMKKNHNFAKSPLIIEDRDMLKDYRLHGIQTYKSP